VAEVRTRVGSRSCKDPSPTRQWGCIQTEHKIDAETHRHSVTSFGHTHPIPCGFDACSCHTTDGALSWCTRPTCMGGLEIHWHIACDCMFDDLTDGAW